MAAGLQAAGLVLALVSWCLQSSSTSSQMWKVKSQGDTVSSNIWQYEGLWTSCVATSTGSIQCSSFKTLLGLPIQLQACRALMLLSLLLGLASILVSVLGLRCTKIGRSSEEVKDRLALSGGVMFILSGLLTLTAVSWYAAQVIYDFHNPVFGGQRFELGRGLYLGWTSTCLALVGGSILCCTFRRNPSPPPTRSFSYTLSPSGPARNIYRAAPASDVSGIKAYV